MNLNDLYQEVILDHNKNPRNFCENEQATNFAKGFNPLCGDNLKIYLTIKDEIITSANFTGCGCAISIASASLLTESIVGKSQKEASSLFEKIHLMLTQDDVVDDIGKLYVLSGVKQFPARVKCATLAWHTMMAAMENSKKNVKTE